jgi:probable selenium-dependent hydroxylase accessory protein YqeC
MKIYKLLNIDFRKSELICFVGAGGKTTTLFKLAEELKSLNKKVLATTTTSIYCPVKDDYDELIIDNCDKIIECLYKVKKAAVTVIGKGVSKENKLLGIDREIVQEIHDRKFFDYTLVEGDGSRRKPIKSPASYEPVIPCNTDKVVGVIGLDSLGKKINEENVHRPQIFCRATGSKIEEVINEETIFKLIINEAGLFKDVPSRCKKYVFLNKIENEETKNSGYLIKDLIVKSGLKVAGIIGTSMINGRLIFNWSDRD